MTDPNLPDLSMNTETLYREDVYSDQQVGSVRVMVPVTSTGEKDASRAVRYAGQTQLMTPAGALPLTFEIEASSLEQAIARFGTEAQTALEQTMEELKEMRRQQASSIVVPGSGVDGLPSGGKIQMP